MGQINKKSKDQVKTEETKVAKDRLISVIQHYLDSKAQERGYDNIISLCTYATSASARFKAEGQAGVEWRDRVWEQGYELLNDFESGKIQRPTESELLSKLPELTWPN